MWAGVDKVWEQEKPEATLREMLAAGAARCPKGGSPQRQAARPVSEAKRGARFVGTLLALRDLVDYPFSKPEHHNTPSNITWQPHFNIILDFTLNQVV